MNLLVSFKIRTTLSAALKLYISERTDLNYANCMIMQKHFED